MKTERSRLKTRFMVGETKCPIHIDPGQWEKLRHYWDSSYQKEKAERMARARKQVKNAGNVGRKGRNGSKAVVVSFKTCLL
jgi:hypothetical protein